MAISRRGLLSALSLAALGSWGYFSVARPPSQFYFYSGLSDKSGRNYVVAFDQGGRLQFKVGMPDRVHSGILHPRTNELVVFARRPGQFFTVTDALTGKIRRVINSMEGRHFYGHGIFSRNGRFLYASENHFEQGVGVIGIYDAVNKYRRVDEWYSGGIGPHEIALLHHSRHLVVANGGVLTHPDTGRARLNLQSMRPNLSCINLGTGEIDDVRKLPEEYYQLSIRHISVSQNDLVCFSTQFYGDQGNPPLIGFHRPGQVIRQIQLPPNVQSTMRNYCGSTKWDQSGCICAISAPRGNRTIFIDHEGRYINQAIVGDGSGLMPTAEGDFIISSGAGKLYRFDSERNISLLINETSDTMWDNHLFR